MEEPRIERKDGKPELVETELKGARNWLLIIAAIALLSLIAGNFRAPLKDAETISTAGLSRLVLETRSADVTISQGRAADISVTMSAPRSASRLLDVSRQGNSLEISTRRRVWPFSLQPFGRIAIEVTLPARFTPALELDASSGNIVMNGLQLSNLDVTVTSGSVEIVDTDITADARLHSRSGLLRISDSSVGSQLNATTRSGALTITGTDAAGYVLNARSGDITAAGLPGTALTAAVRSGRLSLGADSLQDDWQLSARSGSINVSFGRLPRDVKFDYRGRSGSWSVAEHYGLNVSAGEGNQVVAGNGNGPRLSVETRSGSFRLD